MSQPLGVQRHQAAALRSLRACALATLLLASAAAAMAQSEASAVLERLRKGGTLVIAHRESSVPFSYVDANGKALGYAVELCQKLAESLRKQLKLSALPIRYLPVTPSSRIETIVKGEADLECGSTTNNAERREKVAFTVPHYITGARFLVRSDSNVGDLTDFEGKRLVSTKGTTPLKAVIKANLERLLRINVIEAPEHAKAMEMVAKGEADGFVMDDVLLYGLIAGQPEPGKFKVVGKLLTIEPLAIMLPKGDAGFKRAIDEEMKRLIRSNEAVAVYERWFLQPIPPKGTALNLPMNYLLRDFWKYPTDVVPF
jgi:ABC-type amino acid transport substrate-binding protein